MLQHVLKNAGNSIVVTKSRLIILQVLCGFSDVQIASGLGVKPEHLRLFKSSQAFIRAMDEVKLEQGRHLNSQFSKAKQAQDKALDLCMKIMDHENPTILEEGEIVDIISVETKLKAASLSMSSYSTMQKIAEKNGLERGEVEGDSEENKENDAIDSIIGAFEKDRGYSLQNATLLHRDDYEGEEDLASKAKDNGSLALEAKDNGSLDPKKEAENIVDTIKALKSLEETVELGASNFSDIPGVSIEKHKDGSNVIAMKTPTELVHDSEEKERTKRGNEKLLALTIEKI